MGKNLSIFTLESHEFVETEEIDEANIVKHPLPC